MKKKFSGVVVPMITPLTKAKKIDKDAVVKIMTSFSQNNIHPLVLGTTGESASISVAKSQSLMKAAIDCRGENQLIYAGVVGNQVDELANRALSYLEMGADALVATLPSYYVLTSQQMKSFYLNLADRIQAPLFIYNIKATTQMSIPLDVIDELSYHPFIVGLKDSERDMARMQACISKYKDRADFSYFCGWGAESYSSLKHGADGIVPSTGNLVPELYKKLWEASVQGDWQLCESMQEQTDQFAQQYQPNRTLGESLATLKALMKRKNLCQEWMMPPLTEVQI